MVVVEDVILYDGFKWDNMNCLYWFLFFLLRLLIKIFKIEILFILSIGVFMLNI